MTDNQLMLAHANGRPNAFDVLYQRYHRPLMSYVSSRSAHPEDVAQDVWTAVHEKAHQFNPKYQFKNWLFTIARNRCTEIRRKKTVEHAPFDLDLVPRQEHPGLEFDEKAILHKHVKKLPTWYRQVIREIFLKGRSYREAADKLGIQLGTVKSRVGKGLNKLRASVCLVDPC